MDLPALVHRQLVPTTTTTSTTSTNTNVPEGFVEENGRLVPFWYTRTGYIIKWSILLGLMVLFTLYVLIGSAHAKRRIRKGLAPLGYHRWLVSGPELARADPRYAYPQGTYGTYRPDYMPQYYNMQPNMPPPPPIYDPSGRPPMYDGPAGATKVAPNQWSQAPPPPTATRPGAADEEEYGAPSGPPPSAMQANNTGASNPFRG